MVQNLIVLAKTLYKFNILQKSSILNLIYGSMEAK